MAADPVAGRDEIRALTSSAAARGDGKGVAARKQTGNGKRRVRG
jgi:hypothetical protein